MSAAGCPQVHMPATRPSKARGRLVDPVDNLCGAQRRRLTSYLLDVTGLGDTPGGSRAALSECLDFSLCFLYASAAGRV